MKIINLGNNCVIALILNLLNLRKEALPFDWIEVKTFQDLINIFKNNFLNFINFNLLKNTNKFTTVNAEVFKNTTVKKEKTVVYTNKKFNINFVHEFIYNKDINKIYPIVYDKYKRRIERMFNIINKDELIAFILYYPDLTNDKILKFKKILKKINSNIKYNFYIITNNKKIINSKTDNIFYINDNLPYLNISHYNDNNLRNFFYKKLHT